VLAVPGYLSFVGGPYPALARLSLKDSASVDGEGATGTPQRALRLCAAHQRARATGPPCWRSRV